VVLDPANVSFESTEPPEEFLIVLLEVFDASLEGIKQTEGQNQGSDGNRH
jgi:hypothetical protein